ncbi:MAG: hypothetical protein E6K54_09050 [Gammaproteobacteria bacterium]|nr:MAG: hypothetical protein E6K54_09050 [Gammaproteobacteria bacterium]
MNMDPYLKIITQVAREFLPYEKFKIFQEKEVKRMLNEGRSPRDIQNITGLPEKEIMALGG